MAVTLPPDAEWLETDGRGGFATGTVSGARSRRYHNVLMHADGPSGRRWVLVAGFDAWCVVDGTRCFLTRQRYAGGATSPEGYAEVRSFDGYPWPHWEYALPDGQRLDHSITVMQDQRGTVLRWQLYNPIETTSFQLRFFLVCRDYHSLRRHDESFRLDSRMLSGTVLWHPDPDAPVVAVDADGAYTPDPLWYYNFSYDAEQARGYDSVEDAGSPGVFTWELGPRADSATVVLRSIAPPFADVPDPPPVSTGDVARVLSEERASRTQRSRLDHAAGMYIVRRPNGASIIAGYPWFTDWGRDTFIAIRGLCFATERYDDAREVLLTWAGAVSEGMLPNRFPDGDDPPEYNAVDASLWFVIAAHEYLEATAGADESVLREAILAIIAGYAAGTRYGIRMDRDGLIRAGEAGGALTWMDAVVDGVPVTPRVGKPVEVQCLWLNALAIASAWSPRWGEVLDRAKHSFVDRFWRPDRGYLADVVDRNHEAGGDDLTLRPNQILAAGGLPLACVSRNLATWIVNTVERELLTPAGLRTLSLENPNYRGRYTGGLRARDIAYHQGTVWPWLMGPFAEAWLRVRDFSDDACEEAKRRFLGPLERRLETSGLGHLSELADGDPPHADAGCPFQAWSLGEYLRLRKLCETRPQRNVWNLMN